MRQYLTLTKAFMGGGGVNAPQQKHTKLFYGVLGIISVGGIMIPACILTGVIAYVMTLAVVQAGGSIQGLSFILQLISVFSILFGMNVVLNKFYFSGEMETILPLPLKPQNVAAAKFTVTYFDESVMEFLILLSAFIGFMTADGVSFGKIVLSLIGVFTIPILPLLYCAFVGILLMFLLRKVRNKNHIHKVIAAVTILVMLGFIASICLLGGFDIDSYVKVLVEDKNTFVNVLGIVFFHIPLFLKAMQGSIWAVFAYVAVHVLVIGLFLLMAKVFYYPGVIGLSVNGTQKKEKPLNEILDDSQIKPLKRELFKKEIKVLFRTPSYFMNCIIVHFLWPVLAFVAVMLSSGGKSFFILLRFYQNGNEKMQFYVPLGIVIVTVLMTAVNSIASSAISREGKQLYFVKMIPVSYRVQLKIKALTSIMITGVFFVLYLIVGAVLSGIPFLAVVYYFILGMEGIFFFSFFGILLDTINPKLVWDDELDALRGNANIFFNMAYAMLIAVMLVGIFFVLMEYTGWSIFTLQMILLGVMTVMDIVIYVICMKNGNKNLCQFLA